MLVRGRAYLTVNALPVNMLARGCCTSWDGEADWSESFRGVI